MYVYCNRSQKTTPCKEQLCTFCSLRTVTSSVIYYSTHTWKNLKIKKYKITVPEIYEGKDGAKEKIIDVKYSSLQ